MSQLDLSPHETAKELLKSGLLCEGTEFFRWKEGETCYAPVHLSIDPQAYYVLEDPKGQALIGERKRRTHDLLLVSDLSSGRVRRCRNMSNLMEPQGLELKADKEDCFMCLVERNQSNEGGHYIVNTTYTYFAHTDPAVIARWCEAVNKLSYHTAQLNMGLLHQLNKLLTKLKFEFVSESGLIEVKNFLKLLGLQREKRKATEVLQQIRVVLEENSSLIKADLLSVGTLWEFYSRFLSRPDLEAVFLENSSKRPFLEVKKFVAFLNKKQRDPRKNVQLYPLVTTRKALQMIRKYETEAKLGEGEGEKKITFDCFHKLLMSDDTPVVDRMHLSRCDDLNLSLCSYFINSSHNTYLTGNQLASHSSVEMYIQALLLGSRCVELDCWDGSTDPIITHGNTLCSKISFEEVVRAIADFAFVKSDAPVILSFENHCSTPQQRIMARLCVKYFGSKLLDHPLSDYSLSPRAPLPPPSALRNKILIKNKKASNLEPPEPDDKTEKDEEELETDSIDKNLGSLVNYVEPIKFKSFEESESCGLNYQMSSFSEVKALDYMQEEGESFLRYNITHNSRIYPAGARINSSNYMPQLFWNVGCQMVALNFQTPDLSMQLNQAKFEFNGNCGYLIKPDLLLNPSISFDPFSQTQPGNKVPTALTLKIFSAQFLGQYSKDVQVQCELFGLPADTCRGQKHKNKWTKFVPFNGVAAYWEAAKEIKFPRILCEELALLRLAVVDDSSNLLAHRVLPVSSLQNGYRHVFLRDRCSHPIPLASLFVHIEMDDYVSPEMEEYVKMLENPETMKTHAVRLDMADAATFKREAVDALLYGTYIESAEGSLDKQGELTKTLNQLSPKNAREKENVMILQPSMRMDRLHSDLVPRRKLSDSGEISVRNNTFVPPSCKERLSESGVTLPVVRLARERKMFAPTEVLVVLKECKEYNKLIKQFQKERLILEKSCEKELSSIVQKSGAHLDRLSSLDGEISKKEKEQRRLSARPSQLIRMQTVSEDLEQLKETKGKQIEMSDAQRKFDVQLVEEKNARRLGELRRAQELREKQLVRKLVSEHHQELKGSLLAKLQSGECKQLEKEIEIKKKEIIHAIMQLERPSCQKEMTESVANMITSQQAQLAVVHELELQSYKETAQRILRDIDLEVFQLSGSITDSGCSLDYTSSMEVLPP